MYVPNPAVMQIISTADFCSLVENEQITREAEPPPPPPPPPPPHPPPPPPKSLNAIPVHPGPRLMTYAPRHPHQLTVGGCQGPIHRKDTPTEEDLACVQLLHY